MEGLGIRIALVDSYVSTTVHARRSEHAHDEGSQGTLRSLQARGKLLQGSGGGFRVLRKGGGGESKGTRVGCGVLKATAERRGRSPGILIVA